MNKQRKNKIVLIILILIVIAIIGIIYYIKDNGNSNESIKCISEKSKVVVSPTCSWCAKQKQDLKPYLDYFEFIDISKNPEILKQYNIRGTPSWIIKGEVYSGYHSIKELKELTGC